MMLSSSAVDRVCGYRLETTAKLIAVGLLASGRSGCGPPAATCTRRRTPGAHLAFAVDEIDAVLASLRARGAELVGEVENYENIYRLCYVSSPEGIIVELAEQIG
jgi:catechol 2,3-dioxygenase-like lactoylglutathione lyase family enzyme